MATERGVPLAMTRMDATISVDDFGRIVPRIGTTEQNSVRAIPLLQRGDPQTSRIDDFGRFEAGLSPLRAAPLHVSDVEQVNDFGQIGLPPA